MTTRPNALQRRLAAGLAAVATVAAVGTASTAVAVPPAPGSADDFGVNVTVFDPSMPVGEIQAALDAVHAAQVNNEMGTNRYAFLFKPGTYGTAAHPLQIKVGYYTEIAGLGASPTDVVISRSTSTRRGRTAAGGRPTSGRCPRRCRCGGSTSAERTCR